MKYRTYDDDTLDMFDHIYESIKDPSTSEYKQYMELVKTYNYHPDDDFETIINIMIEEVEMDFF